MPKLCQKSLDKVGKICHLREVLTKSLKFDTCGDMWSIMEDYGESLKYTYNVYITN